MALYFCRIMIWFAFYSIFGWTFECIYYSLLDQKLVNSGFLRGPYCPVYGFGALVVILPLGSVENPAVIFFTSILLAGSVEYFTGWLLEKMFNAKWWDYSAMPGNINGRVFPLSLLTFGVMSLFAIKIANPFIDSMLIRLSPLVLGNITGAFLAVILLDTVYSVLHIKRRTLSIGSKLNAAYQSALKACPPLRNARGVMEKVIWGGNPAADHGRPSLRNDSDVR